MIGTDMPDDTMTIEIDDDLYAVLKARADWWETTPDAFATEILRDWFVNRGLGVAADVVNRQSDDRDTPQ
jgi:hypothetical protein